MLYDKERANQMKKLIPLILVMFVLSFGLKLRSDEMHQQQEKALVAHLSASIDRDMSALLGYYNVSRCNFSKCSVLP